MNEIGQLREVDGQFEYRDQSRNLIVRGEHPEWVLHAAAEVISNTAEMEAQSLVEEMTAMLEFDAAEEIELDSAKFAMKQRFEMVPQCIVSLGTIDYKWAAKEGRQQKPDEFGERALKRVHDMSLTKTDSFLKNEPGVDMGD